MKKFYVLLMVGFLLPQMLFAQSNGRLFGSVKDAETGEELIGATVYIPEINKGAAANFNGEYEINDIPPGTYEIQVKYLGFETLIKKNVQIKASKNIELNFDLKTSAVYLNPPIIRATRASDATPTTFTNVSKVELEKINLGQDLPFLLSNTPSAVVTSDGGAGIGYTGLRIRGSDITRINVTINGIPLNDPESHLVYWVNMPDFASSIEDLQIQRGVGTSTNGAGAFGSSININTMTVADKAFAEYNVAYGSFNTLKNNIKFGTGLINDHFAIEGRLSQINSDGYIDRAWSDLSSYYLSAAYVGDNSMLKLNVFSGKEHTYQAWAGVPKDSLETNRTYNPYTYENQTDNYQQDHYQLIYSYNLNNRTTLNAAAHYTKGGGYYESYKSGEDFEDYMMDNVIIGGDTITSTDLIRQKHLDNDFYGAVASVRYAIPNKLDLNIGGAYNIYQGDHFGKVIWSQYAADNTDIDRNYYENDAVKKDFNIYARAIYTIKKVNIFADLQYRHIDYTFLGFDQDLNSVEQSVHPNFFNPKAGISYNFNSYSDVYASVAVGNKEPNRSDYTESTPDSRPTHETLYDVEFGYRLKKNMSFLNINGYYMYYKNQLIATGEINDVGSYIRTNIPESYRAGIEINGKYAVNKSLIFGGDIALSKNIITSYSQFVDDWDTWGQVENTYENTTISFSPSIVGGANITYSPFKGFYAILEGRYVGRQYMDNTTNLERSLDPYFVSNLHLAYSVPTKKITKSIEIKVMLNNILNTSYESNGWVYSYVYGGENYTDYGYYPQAGFNFLTQLTLKF